MKLHKAVYILMLKLTASLVSFVLSTVIEFMLFP